MSKIKSDRKGSLLFWFIVIIVIVAIAGIVIGISEHNRRQSELKLSNANNTLNEIATETGLVDKSEGSFYITLYVTAGFILLAGVGVFIYIYKKADE